MEKLRIQNQYIGTHRDIVCFVESEKRQIISDYIDNLMKQFEADFSRFRKGSLLSILNEKRVLPNSNKDLLAMLQIGELYRTLSGGYFSLFVGSDLENLGYGWSSSSQ
jgi:thiamine biosynthesis lipoprotein ApbE